MSCARTETTPGVRATSRSTSWTSASVSSQPASSTSPSRTETSTADGSAHSVRSRISSRISRSIWASGRVNARTRSARVTMPTSRPSRPTTGSLLTPCSTSSRAAAVAVRCGRIGEGRARHRLADGRREHLPGLDGASRSAAATRAGRRARTGRAPCRGCRPRTGRRRPHRARRRPAAPRCGARRAAARRPSGTSTGVTETTSVLISSPTFTIEPPRRGASGGPVHGHPGRTSPLPHRGGHGTCCGQSATAALRLRCGRRGFCCSPPRSRRGERTPAKRHRAR